MKVIENNYHETKSWKIVCEKCNSVLEYEKEDVINSESNFHYIMCPCCGASIDVKHW